MSVRILARLGLAVTLAASGLSSAGAQTMMPRSTRPELSAALARPTPEQAFARLPIATQARLTSLADRDPLTGGALSATTTNALAALAGGGVDISTLTTIVMMLVARDAESDLREQMDQVQAMRDAMRASRQADCPPQSDTAAQSAERATLAIPPSRAAADAVSGAVLQAPAPPLAAAAPSRQPAPTPCFSDEMAALRLQQAMDRRNAAMAMLSNVLRQQSETSEAITQNIK